MGEIKVIAVATHHVRRDHRGGGDLVRVMKAFRIHRRAVSVVSCLITGSVKVGWGRHKWCHAALGELDRPAAICCFPISDG